jgi:hypothetical protein
MDAWWFGGGGAGHERMKQVALLDTTTLSVSTHTHTHPHPHPPGDAPRTYTYTHTSLYDVEPRSCTFWHTFRLNCLKPLWDLSTFSRFRGLHNAPRKQDHTAGVKDPGPPLRQLQQAPTKMLIVRIRELGAHLL